MQSLHGLITTEEQSQLHCVQKHRKLYPDCKKESLKIILIRHILIIMNIILNVFIFPFNLLLHLSLIYLHIKCDKKDT